MEQGHWLLLDNANFCNPSVLDRLNPLLERGGELEPPESPNPSPNPNPNPNPSPNPNPHQGELELPESGLLAGGRVRTIRRHPAFRLILTVDPSRGELSRAMRNRGVEVAGKPLEP